LSKEWARASARNLSTIVMLLTANGEEHTTRAKTERQGAWRTRRRLESESKAPTAALGADRPHSEHTIRKGFSVEVRIIGGRAYYENEPKVPRS